MNELDEMGSSRLKNFLASNSALVAVVVMCSLAAGFLYFF